MTGGENDEVRLIINGDELHGIYQSYNVMVSCFEQPSAFSLTLGTGEIAAKLRARYQKGDPFKMLIGDTSIITGNIDGLSFGGAAGVCTIRGRSRQKRLVDGYPSKELSFRNETYFELVDKILELAGLQDASLFADNTFARKKFTGIDAAATSESTEEAAKRANETELTPSVRLGSRIVSVALSSAVDGLAPVPGIAARIALEQQYELSYQPKKVVRQARKLKLGTTWWDFLQEQLKKIGLFLWCDGDGDFVLAEPNPNQEASYRIVKRTGLTREQGNVVDYEFTDGAPGTHSSVVCYGRTGGKKNGRVKCRGEFVTSPAREDMTLAFIDQGVTSDAEAEYAARKRAAEERRNAWTLSYTMSGHRVLATNARSRGIWGFDTVADVEDDYLGIYGPHYVHTVRFSRGEQGTTSTTHLMRPEDMIFSETLTPS